jgi:GST-like protein
MIDLYTYATPNGHKASIMLEETGLPYTVHVVDLERGDQHLPEFRALSPNAKIPVIVDRATHRTVFESGAILLYLAQKSGRFNPATADKQMETLQWLFFQVGHIGPMMGQLCYFEVAPEKIPLAIERYECVTLDEHPNLKRWHQVIAKRPAVIRGLAVPNLTEL